MDKVEPYDCWEGVMNGCLEDKDLDNILSILDFPMEGLEGDGFTEEWDASKSQCLGPLPPNMLTDTGLPVLLPMSAKDAHEEEVVDFHTQSPVSVLQGNNGLSSIVKSCISKRARSKRARRSGPSPWLSMLPPFAPAKKAQGRRKKPSPDHKEPLHNEVKKCVHCEVTKTPQWREGPKGPKTLCNACGVRYRSGRLFPEYRPVASPTFVPSIHSNSHRKVIEMRNKGK